MPKMTMEELIVLTTVRECPDCGLRHAPVRSCEDAKEWEDYLSSMDERS